MHELTAIFPDATLLLALEPEELGAKVLFLLRRRTFPTQMFMPSSLISEMWPSFSGSRPSEGYGTNRRSEIERALVEAWAWLESQALIVHAPDSNGANGWKILSRRAERFADETEFVRYSVARMLQKDHLHPRIRDKVWMAFMRGEFDVAVFQAMKAVEVSVREAAQLDQNAIGVPLMRNAFNSEHGVLSDSAAEPGERVARMELFAGAIGSYKNPHSHRDVDLDDPVEVIEIIFLANHLLRIADTRAAELGH